MLQRRKAMTAALAKRVRGAADDAAEALFPLLLEFVSRTTWEEDGKPRVTGTLSLFVDEGVWKLMLKDRDDPAVAFVSGASLEAVLVAAESGLASGGLEWRADRQARPGRTTGR